MDIMKLESPFYGPSGSRVSVLWTIWNPGLRFMDILEPESPFYGQSGSRVSVLWTIWELSHRFMDNLGVEPQFFFTADIGGLCFYGHRGDWVSTF